MTEKRNYKKVTGQLRRCSRDSLEKNFSKAIKWEGDWDEKTWWHEVCSLLYSSALFPGWPNRIQWWQASAAAFLTIRFLSSKLPFSFFITWLLWGRRFFSGIVSVMRDRQESDDDRVINDLSSWLNLRREEMTPNKLLQITWQQDLSSKRCKMHSKAIIVVWGSDWDERLDTIKVWIFFKSFLRTVLGKKTSCPIIACLTASFRSLPFSSSVF